MTVLIALLRGINVGAKTSLSMEAVRGVAEGLGYRDVRSYIQSGNLVLSTRVAPARVARDLTKKIGGLGGITPEVAVRTHAQLIQIVAANPFVARGEDPTKVHVVFLLDPEARTGTLEDLARRPGEEVVAVGSELHLFLPDGAGRSPLAAAVGKRGPQGTIRNWRTVAKLLDMAGGT